ncbi:hypothetical protein Pmani_005798 [Petrolisthes manimaculis]|uniref:Uncharacterized protein n=1 Tax=Petrolisthes manimaculis TaxID=1843537 RepID=A0AAE1QBM7_9EUCA|nr:hypothetical protein Pmani_005798 [Petrolisthes manimaculis]
MSQVHSHGMYKGGGVGEEFNTERVRLQGKPSSDHYYLTHQDVSSGHQAGPEWWVSVDRTPYIAPNQINDILSQLSPISRQINPMESQEKTIGHQIGSGEVTSASPRLPSDESQAPSHSHHVKPDAIQVTSKMGRAACSSGQGKTRVGDGVGASSQANVKCQSNMAGQPGAGGSSVAPLRRSQTTTQLRTPLWDRARVGIKQIKNKCGANCRHGQRLHSLPSPTTNEGISPSTCQVISPTSSLPPSIPTSPIKRNANLRSKVVNGTVKSSAAKRAEGLCEGKVTAAKCVSSSGCSGEGDHRLGNTLNIHVVSSMSPVPEIGELDTKTDNSVLSQINSPRSSPCRHPPETLNNKKETERTSTTICNQSHIKQERQQASLKDKSVENQSKVKRERPQFLPLGKTVVPSHRAPSCHLYSRHRTVSQSSSSSSPGTGSQVTTPVSRSSSSHFLERAVTTPGAFSNSGSQLNSPDSGCGSSYLNSPISPFTTTSLSIKDTKSNNPQIKKFRKASQDLVTMQQTNCKSRGIGLSTSPCNSQDDPKLFTGGGIMGNSGKSSKKMSSGFSGRSIRSTSNTVSSMNSSQSISSKDNLGSKAKASKTEGDGGTCEISSNKSRKSNTGTTGSRFRNIINNIVKSNRLSLGEKKSRCHQEDAKQARKIFSVSGRLQNSSEGKKKTGATTANIKRSTSMSGDVKQSSGNLNKIKQRKSNSLDTGKCSRDMSDVATMSSFETKGCSSSVSSDVIQCSQKTQNVNPNPSPTDAKAKYLDIIKSWPSSASTKTGSLPDMNHLAQKPSVLHCFVRSKSISSQNPNIPLSEIKPIDDIKLPNPPAVGVCEDSVKQKYNNMLNTCDVISNEHDTVKKLNDTSVVMNESRKLSETKSTSLELSTDEWNTSSTMNNERYDIMQDSYTHTQSLCDISSITSSPKKSRCDGSGDSCDLATTSDISECVNDMTKNSFKGSNSSFDSGIGRTTGAYLKSKDNFRIIEYLMQFDEAEDDNGIACDTADIKCGAPSDLWDVTTQHHQSATEVLSPLENDICDPEQAKDITLCDDIDNDDLAGVESEVEDTSDVNETVENVRSLSTDTQCEPHHDLVEQVDHLHHLPSLDMSDTDFEDPETDFDNKDIMDTDFDPDIISALFDDQFVCETNTDDQCAGGTDFEDSHIDSDYEPDSIEIELEANTDDQHASGTDFEDSHIDSDYEPDSIEIELDEWNLFSEERRCEMNNDCLEIQEMDSLEFGLCQDSLDMWNEEDETAMVSSWREATTSQVEEGEDHQQVFDVTDLEDLGLYNIHDVQDLGDVSHLETSNISERAEDTGEFYPKDSETTESIEKPQVSSMPSEDTEDMVDTQTCEKTHHQVMYVERLLNTTAEEEVASDILKGQQLSNSVAYSQDYHGDLDSNNSSCSSSRSSSPSWRVKSGVSGYVRSGSEGNIGSALRLACLHASPSSHLGSTPSLALSGSRIVNRNKNIKQLRSRLSGSTSNLHPEQVSSTRGNLSAWASMPRLHRDSLKILTKSSHTTPKALPLSSVPTGKQQGRGWNALRRKVIQDRAWRKVEAPDICQGGGEDTIEWDTRKHSNHSSTRPPRLSKIFGGITENVRSTRQQLMSSSVNPENQLQNGSSHQPQPAGAPESGLGSSFDDTPANSTKSSNASINVGKLLSPPPSPGPSRQVVDAITNYLQTVDLVESEDDSFNHEADYFDPDDLVLLTDSEDVVSCHDLVIGSSRQNLNIDFNSPSPSPCSDRVTDDLQSLLKPHFPTSSFDWSPSRSPCHNSTTGRSISVSPTTQTPLPATRDPKTDQKCTDGKEIETLVDMISSKTDMKCETSGSANTISNQTTNTDSPTLTATASEDTRGRSRCKKSEESECESDCESECSRKRNVSCSDNMRAFLMSQPCAAAHASGEQHYNCTDTHVLDTSIEVSVEVVAGQPLALASHGHQHINDNKPKKKVKNKKKKKNEDRRGFSVSVPSTPTPRRGLFRRGSSQGNNNNNNSTTGTSFWSRWFCTTPVTVEGFPESQRDNNSTGTGTSSHDSDPEPLPPPIPPHGADPATVITAPIRSDVSDSISPHTINNNNVVVVGRADSTSPTPDNNNILLPRADSPTRTASPTDPEVMTADEAQRLLSSKESQGLLSDEEAQEVVLLLSPPHESPQDPSQCLPPPPPPVPPHTQDPGLMKGEGRYDIDSAFDSGFASETVTRYDPDTTFDPAPGYESTDKFDPTQGAYNPSVAYDPVSKFDPTLTSPLSPEDEPSEADSSEASGDISQVTRVKEVLVEDGVHYLEDGHFWVEVPGLAEEWEDEDDDPNMPFHPHTRLTFSTRPVQVFSTYSVSEYDRKNDEVDPVAASAEYELEKRVEKMDLFPVQILKGEGGLGLSIIGMGVGADAGVEKLGIFVKTITPSGATQRDGRIQVNDQIIEVDGKSLVGVTQVFAASVLKNTSGEVNFLIGREKDPENSEVALLIKQSLQADREREERRRALGGPDYDPHTGQALFDPLSSPSEENSRSEDVPPHHHHHHHHHPHYPGYMEGMGQSPPTSPDATSPPPEVYDLEGDTSDNSSDADTAMLRKKLKEYQYRNAVAEAEVAKLKMSLVEMERKMGEGWAEGQGRLQEADRRTAELDGKLVAKSAEASTYQDMLEQSQGQFIILEKKYYKAKKIIKEYQGREQDFQHREEYHITLLEEKDSHYNALVKALKDRVIQLEGELVGAQKTAGLPVQVPPADPSHPTHWHPPQPQTSTKQPPRKPSLCTLASDLSDTENSDTSTSDGHKANTVERKLPVKEELDEAVPPHELLDVSASRAKGELAARGGLANRHLPSLKKTTSMSSAGSQDHSLDDSSLDDELPEALKYQQAVVGPAEGLQQEAQQDSRRSGVGESGVPSHVPASSSVVSAKATPALHPPSHSQTSQQHTSLSQPTQVIPSHAQPSQHPPAHSQLAHHALAYSQPSQNPPSHSQPVSSHPPLSQPMPGHVQASHQSQTNTQNISSHSQPFPSHPQVSQSLSGHSQPSKTPPQICQLPPAHSQPSPIAPSHPLPSHPPPSYQQSSSGHQQPPPSYSQSSQQYPSQSQPSPSPPQAFAQPPLPSYTQATMSSHLSSHHPPPPPYHPPPRQPHPPRPDIPYRHPPPVARVGPVSRVEGPDVTPIQQQQQQHSSTPSLASHLAARTPQQQSLAEQLKALLAEREVDNESSGVMRRERDASPSKRSPTSLIEDVRQAVMQADVSSLHHHHHHHHLATSSSTTTSSHQISSSTCSTSTSSSISAISPQRAPSAFYPPAGRESLRERDGIREGGTGGAPPSPKAPRSTPTAPHHPSPVAVSPNPSGVVLLSQRPLDSSHKLAPGMGEGGGGSSGDLSSGPASLGSGDEGSGASLGGSQTSLTPPDRSRRAHMWQTAPVVDWTKEQVGQWLVVQGLEGCVGRFIEVGMTGPRLLNLDLRDLKSLHLPQDDKTKLKRKVKELRLAVEKERKQAEKEKKEREKLQKKAEKLAEKAERKKK